MAESNSHPIRNGVIIGLLVLAIWGALTWIPNLFRWIIHVLSPIGTYLVSSINIPDWVLWLLVCLSVSALYRIIQPFFRRRSIEPRLKDYTSDTFYNAHWEWRY